MSNKSDNLSYATGWQLSGPGKDRRALILDVLVFVPGLLLAGLVLGVQFYAVHNRTPLFTRGWLALLTVPSLAGLISAVGRWKTTPPIAFLSVSLYWGTFVLLGGISLQGFALFFWLLVPLILLFLVAVSTTLFVGIRMGPIWAVPAVALGILVGIAAIATHVYPHH